MGKRSGFRSGRLTRSPYESQAGENISYNFHSLGWAQFQDLCGAVLRVALQQEVSTFARTSDGGRDGAFYGKWDPKSGGTTGAGTLQCKFSAKRDAAISLSSITEELQKAKHLAAIGLATNYILLTNMTITAKAESEIREALLSIAGITYVAVYGRQWLTSRINESPHLRMLVPRVYGIGNLQQLLNARSYVQAQEILNYLGGNLSKFVMTNAYHDSVSALSDFGFVILLGSPATGKSTIASALTLGAIDRWKATPIRVSNGREFREAWDANERQCFWVDDAFGATQYQAGKADDWVQTFPYMQTAVSSNATKIIFTSRSYIFERALSDLKTSAFPPIRNSRVHIEVEKYSVIEREAILYNHLRLGQQPTGFKKRLAALKMLPEVARHPRFTPVVARRLADPAYTGALQLTRSDILRFVENQGDYILEALEALDAASYGALSLIFMGGGSIDAPLKRGQDQLNAIASLGASVSDVTKAMRSMEGSFVRRVQRGATMLWQFDHPSLGDAMSSILSHNIDQLEIYIRGAKLDELVTGVTCGATRMQGAVTVPSSLYDLLLNRIDGLGSRVEDRERLLSFLLERADLEFLQLYQTHHPSFTREFARRARYTGYSTQSRLLGRLFNLKLLDEGDCMAAAASILTTAIEELDPSFVNDGAGGLLTQAQVSDALKHIRIERLPQLETIVEDLEDQYEAPADPDDFFADIVDNLETFQNLFSDDVVAVSLIDSALDDIAARREFLREALPADRDDDDSRYDQRSSRIEDLGGRDFFEDVAEPA